MPSERRPNRRSREYIPFLSCQHRGSWRHLSKLQCICDWGAYRSSGAMARHHTTPHTSSLADIDFEATIIKPLQTHVDPVLHSAPSWVPSMMQIRTRWLRCYRTRGRSRHLPDMVYQRSREQSPLFVPRGGNRYHTALAAGLKELRPTHYAAGPDFVVSLCALLLVSQQIRNPPSRTS